MPRRGPQSPVLQAQAALRQTLHRVEESAKAAQQGQAQPHHIRFLKSGALKQALQHIETLKTAVKNNEPGITRDDVRDLEHALRHAYPQFSRGRTALGLPAVSLPASLRPRKQQNPGANTPQEIHRLQNSTSCHIQKLAFMRLIRDIGSGLARFPGYDAPSPPFDHRGNPVPYPRISDSALKTLMQLTEARVVEFFRDMNNAAIHSRRTTCMGKDGSFLVWHMSHPQYRPVTQEGTLGLPPLDE